MIIKIDYSSKRGYVLLSTDLPESEIWNKFTRIMSDYVSDIIIQENLVAFPWRIFLAYKKEVGTFITSNNIKADYTIDARKLLIKSNDRSYFNSIKKGEVKIDYIQNTLISKGFQRTLTTNQLNNLSKISQLPGGATFSVPGAGKTSEALAFFFLNATDDESLLVVAPKNAFGAWDEQLELCMPALKTTFVRLRGGENNIEQLVRRNPRFMIINYQMFPKVKNILAKHMVANSTYMFLDESHRIKGGLKRVIPESILDVSHYPERKLLMSGTPMPQSVQDMIPQFLFLYPEVRIDENNVIDMMKPIFVRTTKGQLNIPEVTHYVKELPMTTLQREVYNLLISEVKRQLTGLLTDNSRIELRKINRSIIKVMQFISNPALLADDMRYIFDDKIRLLLQEADSPKIEYACYRARKLASEGKKVIIWSSFVKNVELISERLRDLGADYIHGGVDAGDEEDDDTREGKIKNFHNDPAKMVLVANPAAASEGISLHQVCQNAIYVDRSFNAAQYLQSEDRIHRLGLKPWQTPIVEILECENSLDQIIRRRLAEKIEKMAISLEDSSLSVDIIPYDLDENEDEYIIDRDDAASILKYFMGGDSNL